MLLVKCHALCDPNGLGYKLSNASASPEQCTLDCALRRLHDGRAAGQHNVTVAPLHVSNLNAEHRRAKLETTRDLLEITRALNNYTKRARFMQEDALAPANHTRWVGSEYEELTQEQLLLKCHDTCGLDG